MTTRTSTIEIAGGVRVVVPDSVNLLTPYVLFEQRDWFEDELSFVRRCLQPGQRAIDIGANYGVYSLTIAKLVAPSGAVWAFEPASATAALLEKGIAANQFTHVVVERSAVSSAPGTAQLTLNENAELNALVRGAGPELPTETVPVVTLDECLQRYDWKDIDFLKIDAEGEESNIIRGGRQLLTESSPLILYEVKAGLDLHLELVREFAALGFESYRMVPGLDLLVPFDAASQPDDYLLNLFCCKEDRASLLAQRGLLLDSAEIDSPAAAKAFQELYRTRGENYSWERRLATLPYGAALATLWGSRNSRDSRVSDALAWYAMSQDRALLPSERFLALQSSFNLMEKLCTEGPPLYMRRASLTRIARDYGARAIALKSIKGLLESTSSENPADPSEAFLAPSHRFDTIAPGSDIARWILASCAEEFERLVEYSSFFTGISARQRLELITSLGFASEEMSRRLQLILLRFGQS